MLTRFVLVLYAAVWIASCSGGDRHLPSSNPPEYDPTKTYTSSNVSSTQSPPQPTKPTELDLLQSKLQLLETASQKKGEGKPLAVSPDMLQLLKGVTSPCQALSRVAQGLGSTQLFAGGEGVALKKALGSEADGIARRIDEQMAEGLKHSLGPAAGDCSISVGPRKRSRLQEQPQPARLVLAHTSSSHPLLLAEATIPETSQDDYHVEKSSSRENVPPDWVGYKTVDTMTRIGRRPHTEGVRESYEMVIAPKAKRCPDPEGMVAGTFEWSFVLYRATSGPDGAQGVLYRRRVVADLKGKVGDDAKVEWVKFDATITLQHIGTQLAAYSHTYGSSGQFTIDQRMMGLPQEFRSITVSDFSAGEAEAKDAQLVGNLTVLVAYFSGLTYFDAQTEWNKPNTCVQITFTPPTKTKKLGPNQSIPVKTELRTKKGQAIVPAKFKEAKERPRERNGTVSPREADSQSGTPATFTYQAPGRRVKHSGFWVAAVSRAGVGEAKEGEWEVVESYVLEFKSHIVQAPLNLETPSFGMGLSSNGFDAHVQATIPLQYTDDRGWVGEGTMQYQTQPTTQSARCEFRIQGSGTTTFHVNGGSISSDPEPFAVNLTILPGQTGEVAEIHCTSANTPEKLKELFATQGVQGGEAHSA
ncbi:MAG TPA: hypothetical protein VH681_05345, partial [Nitrospiraceae bacterium]